MPSRIDDRYLWLAFGVFAFLAAKGVRYAIKDILQLTKVHDVPALQDRTNDGPPEDCMLEQWQANVNVY